MPKFCNSCGTTNIDNITNCINCGAALDDGSYIHLGADNNANSINGIYEPSFGQNGYGQQYGQNYYQPYQTPYYQNYPVPNADFFSQPTTTLGWVGWIIVTRIFPFIGCLVMFFMTNDKSAKNYAKANLAVTAVGAIILAIISILFFSNGLNIN